MTKTIFFLPKKSIFRTVAALLLLSGLASCAPSAKTGKPPLLKRAWHDMNTRYNGYYHARLRVLAGIADLEKGYKDNYQQIVPLFPFVASENVQAVKPKLDEAIKKETVVLALHRPSVWQDDAYFLMGQTEFIKKDYAKAKETFRYVTLKFSPYKAKSLMNKDELAAAKNKKAKDAKKKKITKTKELKKKKKDRAKAAKKKKQDAAKKKRLKKKQQRLKRKGKLKYEYEPGATGNRKQAQGDAPDKPVEADDKDKDKEKGSNLLGDDQEKLRYPLRRKPAFHEAKLWLARTHIELKEYDDAEKLLREMEEDINTPKRLLGEVFAVRAHRFLHEKRYAEAIEPLEKGIELTRNRRKKTRYQYVLAQLRELEGNRAMAAEQYRNVLRGRPTFDMEFNARMNLALHGSENPDQAVAQLNRMLREEKNAEFRDRLYFALGQVALEAGKENEAVENFRRSLAANAENTVLKAEAYYQLSRIFLKREEYVPAVNYMDSTLTVMAKADERFQPTERERNNLKDLAVNLETIALQDSLLRISNLSPEEQKALAKRLKKAREEAAAAGKPAGTGGAAPNVAMAKSEFPLYNDKSKQKGQREFQKRWGNRPLADNWRYVSDQQQGGDAPKDGQADGAPTVVTQDEVEQILADVPKTDEQKKACEKKIQEAMFLAGKLYRDRIEDNQRAFEMLSGLQRRFPGHANEEEALYYLFIICKDLGKNDLAEQYRRELTEKFPKGKFARAANDPGFLTDAQARRKRIDDDYRAAFASFQRSDYGQAYAQSRTGAVDSLYGKDNHLRPKFALLEAMCIGGLRGKDEGIKALKAVKTSYPNTEEAQKAAEMLKYLTGAADPSEPGIEKPKDLPQDVFVFNENSIHFVIVVLDDKKANMDQAKAKITDYNNKYYSVDKLKASGLLLANEVPSVTVRKFANAAKAMDWVAQCKGKPEFLDPAATPHTMFAISQENYTTLIKNRDLAGYRKFFNDNYGK